MIFIFNLPAPLEGAAPALAEMEEVTLVVLEDGRPAPRLPRPLLGELDAARGELTAGLDDVVGLEQLTPSAIVPPRVVLTRGYNHADMRTEGTAAPYPPFVK
nr:hypothetical protein [Nonomuraea aridisoli]